MALVIDGFCVVTPNATVERCFPGGIAAYERNCPNGTYCSDGRISRVAFMAEADALAFADRLASHGFQGPGAGPASEIALVAQHFNRLQPCDWLEVDLRVIVAGDHHQSGATIAWLKGDTRSTVAAPAGWKPGELRFISDANYEFVETKRDDGGHVDTYRHRETGELLYTGRPDVSGVATIQARYRALRDELNDLEARPLRAGRPAALASFLERTAQLVNDTGAREPGPLLLQVIAARVSKQWELAAESARAVTVLRPDFLHAWLDQTWALAELGRLDEAEACARRAVALDDGSVAALGNLATVLLQRGRVEEAFTTINRALERDPADARSQLILERIRGARDHEGPERRTPWYRRLLGR